jgi:hypothetical protein
MLSSLTAPVCQAGKPDRRDLGSGIGRLTRPTSASEGLPVPNG